MALESFYGGKQGVSPVIKESFEFVNTKDPAYLYYKNLRKPVRISPDRAERLVEKGYSDKIHKFKADGELATQPSDEVEYCTVQWAWVDTTTNQVNTEMLDLFTMDECFKSVDYTDVWYDELCIIDTQNKLNPNNGKIFRRTLKRYQNAVIEGFTDQDSMYAEYVGQIVGPSGGVPNIKFGSLDDVRKEAAGRYFNENNQEAYQNVDNWDYLYPDSQTNGSTTTDANLSNRDGDNNPYNDYEQIAILNSGDKGNITIVPGKEIVTTTEIQDDEQVEVQTVKYNDQVRYTWCNVRHNLDNSTEDSAWIYLGFEIPYTFWDTAAEDIPYWDNRESFKVDTQIADNQFHPFYHNLTFYIPRGTRGIGPEEIFIVGKDNRSKPDPLYNFDAIQYTQESIQISYVENEETKTLNIPEDNYYINPNTNKIDPNTDGQHQTYWVAKWTLYNPKTITKQTVYQYLGAYKDISSVSLSNDGILTLHYSDGTEVPMSEKIRWINKIDVDTTLKINNDFNKDYGKMVVTYNTKNNNNNKNETFEEILPLIKDIQHNSSTGELTFNHAGDISIEADGFVKEILDARIKTSNGHLYILYTNGQDQTVPTNEAFQNYDDPKEHGYKDLGQVNSNPTVGIVAQMIKDNGSYADANEVLNILNNLDSVHSNGYESSDHKTKITPTGNIIVNGVSGDGGFVAADFGNDNIGLFYYLNGWQYAGTANSGGGGQKSRVEYISFITTSETIENNESNFNTVNKPENDNATNIRIDFKDSFTTIINNYNPNNPNSEKPEKIHKDFLDTFWATVESS